MTEEKFQIICSLTRIKVAETKLNLPPDDKQLIRFCLEKGEEKTAEAIKEEVIINKITTEHN